MHGSHNTNEGTIPELGYDHRDINIAVIVRWMSIFAAFVVVSILIIEFVAYPFFTPDWRKLERNVPAFVTAPRVPPYPQVQADPKLDMEVYKASEERSVESLKQAKKALAAQGISGVRADTPLKEGNSYPGSGDYSGVEKQAQGSEEHGGGQH